VTARNLNTNRDQLRKRGDGARTNNDLAPGNWGLSISAAATTGFTATLPAPTAAATVTTVAATATFTAAASGFLTTLSTGAASTIILTTAWFSATLFIFLSHWYSLLDIANAIIISSLGATRGKIQTL
jgi:hypothetical protein